MKNFYEKKYFCNSFFIYRRRGVTVAEALIVIAIIGIILTVVLPQFVQIRKEQLLKNTSEDIVTTLSKAKSLTLASLDSSQYGVHFETDNFVFFKGTQYSVDGTGNDIIILRSPVSITAVNLSGGVTSLYFERLSGNPSAFGTITISNGSISRTITISGTGMLSIGS